MPTLIIRDVPEKIVETLKLQAKRHHRSMAKEALAMLEARLNPYDVPPLDWRKLPKPIKLLKPIDMSPESINAMIDEGQK